MKTPTRYFSSLKFGINLTLDTRVEFQELKRHHKIQYKLLSAHINLVVIISQYALMVFHAKIQLGQLPRPLQRQKLQRPRQPQQLLDWTVNFPEL